MRKSRYHFTIPCQDLPFSTAWIKQVPKYSYQNATAGGKETTRILIPILSGKYYSVEHIPAFHSSRPLARGLPPQRGLRAVPRTGNPCDAFPRPLPLALRESAFSFLAEWRNPGGRSLPRRSEHLGLHLRFSAAASGGHTPLCRRGRAVGRRGGQGSDRSSRLPARCGNRSRLARDPGYKSFSESRNFRRNAFRTSEHRGWRVLPGGGVSLGVANGCDGGF